MRYKSLLIGVLIMFSSCAHSNYKYNREVTKRNQMVDAVIHEKPLPTPVWEYVGVSLLFVVLVLQIRKI